MMTPRARQHVISTSWKAMQRGQREPEVQKRFDAYAAALLSDGVHDAMVRSTVNRKTITWSDDDINVYHSVVANMAGAKVIPDLIRTFKTLDLAYSALNYIEQVVNTSVRAGVVSSIRGNFVRIYTNLVGFRIVYVDETCPQPRLAIPTQADIVAHTGAIANAGYDCTGLGADAARTCTGVKMYYNFLFDRILRYCLVATETQRTEGSYMNLCHYLGPTLDPLYSDAAKSAAAFESYVYSHVLENNKVRMGAAADWDPPALDQMVIHLPHGRKGVAISASLLQTLKVVRANRPVDFELPTLLMDGLGGTTLAVVKDDADVLFPAPRGIRDTCPANPIGGVLTADIVPADMYVAGLLKCLMRRYIPYDAFEMYTGMSLMNLDPTLLKWSMDGKTHAENPAAPPPPPGDWPVTLRGEGVVALVKSVVLRFSQAGALQNHGLIPSQYADRAAAEAAGEAAYDADVQAGRIPQAVPADRTARGVAEGDLHDARVAGRYTVDTGRRYPDPRSHLLGLRSAVRGVPVFQNCLHGLKISPQTRAAIMPFGAAQGYDIVEARSVELGNLLSYINNILAVIARACEPGDHVTDNITTTVDRFAHKIGTCPGGGEPQWWTGNPYRDASAMAVPSSHPNALYTSCNPFPRRMTDDDIRQMKRYAMLEAPAAAQRRRAKKTKKRPVKR